MATAVVRVATRFWQECADCLSDVSGDRTVRWVALLLGAMAVTLVGLHIYTMLSLRDGGIADWTIDPTWLRLDRDRSISEFFEYGATLAAALLAFCAWRLARQPIYFAVAIVFLVMAVDNALMLHESMALTLVDRGVYGASSESGAYATAELLFHAVVGGSLVVLALVALYHSGFRHRVRGLILLATVGLAAAFGIGVDFVQEFVGGPSWLDYGLSLAEDGGELLAIFLALTMSVGVVRHLPVGAAPHPEGGAAH